MPAWRKSPRMRAPSAWSARPGAAWSAGRLNLSGCANTPGTDSATSTKNKARWRTGLERSGLLGISRLRSCGFRGRQAHGDGRGGGGRGDDRRQFAVDRLVVLGLVDVGQKEEKAEKKENNGSLDRGPGEDVARLGAESGLGGSGCH